MSYCRWSSDCFQSDLYVYRADNGYVIHVASSRYESGKPRPKIDWATASVVDALAYDEACDAWVDGAKRVPIGLPRDGRTYTLGSAEEAANMVRELWNLGYEVPDGVVESLRGEDCHED